MGFMLSETLSYHYETLSYHYETFDQDVNLDLHQNGINFVTLYIIYLQSSVPPVMAFNLGSLGFLTPFIFANYRETVSQVLEGNIFILTSLLYHHTNNFVTPSLKKKNETILEAYYLLCRGWFNRDHINSHPMSLQAWYINELSLHIAISTLQK